MNPTDTFTPTDWKDGTAYKSTHKWLYMFPNTGKYRRDGYSKHIAFFAAGSSYKERLFMAANRVGKTEAGAYETTCHLTGIYPDWWTGKRFIEPTEGWACGTTNQTTRDIVQRALLGMPDKIGTGMIPADLIVHCAKKHGGLENQFEQIWVKHKPSGKNSIVGLKSYEQGRKSFEGTAKHFVWDDEEPPLDCYTEMLYRTVTTRGIVYTTFTPLQGMSEMVMSFLEPASEESKEFKFYIQAGWKDAPHIDESEKRALIATTPPYQLLARTEGEPTLGAGAIYPIAEQEITCRQFVIPESWTRAYGMDVGWKRTAAIWGAKDPGTGIVYLYREHYGAEAAAAIHALAIKSAGDWIPGVIDPASIASSQHDGTKLLEKYRAAGLNLIAADNDVTTGLTEVWEMMVSGRLKVMPSCENWFREFRKYHRDEKGKIVKSNDHLMDSCIAPESLVVTDQGDVPIVNLVGREGWVLSRSGSWARFSGARKTIVNAPTVGLSFADGSEVRCTPDHPFLTPDGWVNAIEMQGRSCYNGVSQRIQSRTLLSGTAILSFLRQLPKCIRACVTTSAENTSSGTASDCIDACGSVVTASAFPKDSTSTTRITSGATTGAEILSLKPSQNTSVSTTWDTNERSAKRLSMPQPNGTSPEPETNGTRHSGQRPLPKRCRKWWSLPASDAGLSLRQRQQGTTDSVPTTARPSPVRRLAWTMRNALAWCAAELLWRTATFGNPAAREDALVSCLRVREAGTSDVYCLTVPGTSAFCLANGAVVHNTRYLVLSGIKLMKTRPYKKAPVSPRIGGDRGWMA